ARGFRSGDLEAACVVVSVRCDVPIEIRLARGEASAVIARGRNVSTFEARRARHSASQFVVADLLKLECPNCSQGVRFGRRSIGVVAETHGRGNTAQGGADDSPLRIVS